MTRKFGEKLRALREAAKVTLRQLGKEVGCSAVYLSDVELGHRAPPSQEKIIRIAEIINVDPNLLLRLAAQEKGRIELDTDRLKGIRLDAALALGRTIDGLTDEQAEQILRVLKGNAKDE
jgi:transcriptional regulator with XRE-family HTH domain